MSTIPAVSRLVPNDAWSLELMADNILADSIPERTEAGIEYLKAFNEWHALGCPDSEKPDFVKMAYPGLVMDPEVTDGILRREYVFSRAVWAAAPWITIGQMAEAGFDYDPLKGCWEKSKDRIAQDLIPVIVEEYSHA